jgi:hypothetical protein
MLEAAGRFDMDGARGNITDPVIRRLAGTCADRPAPGSAPAAALLAQAASRDPNSGDGCNYRSEQFAFAELKTVATSSELEDSSGKLSRTQRAMGLKNWIWANRL